MNEKVLDSLKAMGFQTEILDGCGCCFEYEGQGYLYFDNDDDESFIDIAIPRVLNKEKYPEMFYQIMDSLNNKMKYVKAYAVDDDMWLFYERELIGEEQDYELLVGRMILRLDAAYKRLLHLLEVAEKDQ